MEEKGLNKYAVVHLGIVAITVMAVIGGLVWAFMYSNPIYQPSADPPGSSGTAAPGDWQEATSYLRLDNPVSWLVAAMVLGVIVAMALLMFMVRRL